jgi:hypothetical protein
MMDPERLLNHGATDLERRILGEAKRERPSSKQSRRMRRALFFAEFGMLAPAAKALAGIASPIVATALLAGALSGSGSMARSTSALPFQHTSSSNLPSSAVPSSAVPSSAPLQPLRTQSPPEAASVDREAPSTLRRQNASTATLSPSTLKGTNIAQEIRLLDQVRNYLRTERPDLAMSSVGRYFARFPHGALRQEAEVLRIEALARSGKPRAVAEARTFRAKHPDSPHIEKLQQLSLGGNTSSPVAPNSTIQR